MAEGTRNRNRHGARPSAPVPNELDANAAFEAFLQRLERIDRNHGNHGNNNAASLRQNGDQLIERFRRFRPEKFSGLGEVWLAEQWLRDMEAIFDTLECSEIDKRRMATFQLTFAAADWWEAEKATLGPDGI